MADAAAYYVEIVSPANCAAELAGFVGAQNSQPDGSLFDYDYPAYYEVMKPLWEGVRDAHQVFLGGLVEYEWPPEV